jgi:hypothetical protein
MSLYRYSVQTPSAALASKRGSFPRDVPVYMYYKLIGTNSLNYRILLNYYFE